MSRTILSVAYPLTEVGPDAVGGSEQILTLLDRALTEAGHRSVVIAARGSKVRGTLIASPAAGKRLHNAARGYGQRVHNRLIREALASFNVDLIHMHSLDFHCYLPPPGVPVLATLHLPPDWYPRRIFQSRRRYFHLNCVSRAQHRSCPESRVLVPPIANGVDVDKLAVRARKDNFVVALGRICPEKGFHFALDAARAAGVRLILGGEVFPYAAHLRYFRRQILPRLGRGCEYAGPLSFTEKRRLLARARCLVVPSTVAETSSLVAMEALACGTPVVAFRVGALPEIIENGRTGLIVSDVEEMALAFHAVRRIDPGACRRAARARFSAERMAGSYFDLYSALIAEKENDLREEIQARWARAAAS